MMNYLLLVGTWDHRLKVEMYTMQYSIHLYFEIKVDMRTNYIGSWDLNENIRVSKASIKTD